MKQRRTMSGLLMATAAVAGIAVAIPATSSASTRTAAHEAVLKAQVLPFLNKMTHTGATNVNRKISVGVVLPIDTALENKTYNAIYTKGSPDYHHFLSVAQFQHKFAVPASTFSTVVHSVEADGLKASYSSPLRDYLLLSGTVGEVDKTFKISTEDYTLKGKHYFANSNAPTVPAGVSHVIGLDNIATPTLPHITVKATKAKPTQGTQSCLESVCIGNLTTDDLMTAYDVPNKNPGSGQRVAIIGSGNMPDVVQALRYYEADNKLPQIPVIENSYGDDPTAAGDADSELEFTLDVEASSGMAPDAEAEELYFADATEFPDLDAAYMGYANDPNAPSQINASIGLCEYLTELEGVNASLDPVFEQDTIEGRTQFESSGDAGDSCISEENGVLNTVVPGVEYPAASPYVVAVGGTDLLTKPDDTRGKELAWLYGGGGTSLSEPEGSYQKSITLVKGKCVLNPDTLDPELATPCRGVPDVAALSGDYEGLSDFQITTSDNETEGVLGTSVSSPLVEGMWADIQATAKNAKGLGFADPVFYTDAANQTKDDADFFDVSLGDNGLYPALPRDPADKTGWDFVTGLGVPIVGALESNLNGTQTPTHPAHPYTAGTVYQGIGF